MCSSDWGEEQCLAGHWQGHKRRGSSPSENFSHCVTQNHSEWFGVQNQGDLNLFSFAAGAMVIVLVRIKGCSFWPAAWQPEPMHCSKDACITTRAPHSVLWLFFGAIDINYLSFSQCVLCPTCLQCEAMLGPKWFTSSSQRSWGDFGGMNTGF